MINNKELYSEQSEQESNYQQLDQAHNDHLRPFENSLTQSKQDKIKRKKAMKREKQLENSLKLMSQLKIEEALIIIKTLIFQRQYMKPHTFQGHGFKQDWDEYLPEGPCDWLLRSLKNGKLSKNLFDLLSICFLTQLYIQKISFKQEFFEFYEQIAQKQGQSVQTYVGRGHLFYAKDQFYEAEKQYLQALKLAQDNQKIYECLGWIKGFWFDSRIQGITYCQKCLQINPNNLGALYVRAYCQPTHQGKIQYNDKIIQKNPAYYKAYIRLGLLSQKFQTKCQLFQKALSFNPKSILTIQCLAIAKYRSCDQRSQAIDMIQQLRQQNPNDAQNYFTLAQILEDGSISQAIENYQKCLQLNPYHLEAIETLAKIYRTNYNHGDNQHAVTLYKQYIQLNPYNCQVFNYLGLAFDDLGYKEDAKANYEKAIQVNHNFFEAYLNLGQSYQEQEKYSQALNYYLKAENIQNNNPNICYGIAICYYKLDKYQQSQEWANKCCDYGADDSHQVYELLGDINFSMENYLKSLKYYIQHSVYLKTLHTQYIMQNLIDRISRTQALQLLFVTYNTVEISENSYYWYYQLAKLHQLLQDYEGAIRNYQALKHLESTFGQMSIKIRREIQRIFGNDRSFGKISLIDKLKIMGLRKKYYESFSQIYGLSQNSQMICQ